MKKIKGGYYIKARCIQESKIVHAPPHIREIWDWLIQKAMWKNGKKLKRGQLVKTYKDIQDGLAWYIGFRKKTYNDDECEKALSWLAKEGMILKERTTRGLLITIINYDLFQDFQNYEHESEYEEGDERGDESENGGGYESDTKAESAVPELPSTPQENSPPFPIKAEAKEERERNEVGDEEGDERGLGAATIEKEINTEYRRKENTDLQSSPALAPSRGKKGKRSKPKVPKPEASIEWLKAIPPETVKELAEYYHIEERLVRLRAEAVIDWCEAKGESYEDYKAGLRTFIRRYIEDHPEAVKKPIVTFEVHSEQGQASMENRPRTPEEQARMDARLADLRKQRELLAQGKTMNK